MSNDPWRLPIEAVMEAVGRCFRPPAFEVAAPLGALEDPETLLEGHLGSSLLASGAVADGEAGRPETGAGQTAATRGTAPTRRSAASRSSAGTANQSGDLAAVAAIAAGWLGPGRPALGPAHGWGTAVGGAEHSAPDRSAQTTGGRIANPGSGFAAAAEGSEQAAGSLDQPVARTAADDDSARGGIGSVVGDPHAGKNRLWGPPRRNGRETDSRSTGQPATAAATAGGWDAGADPGRVSRAELAGNAVAHTSPASDATHATLNAAVHASPAGAAAHASPSDAAHADPMNAAAHASLAGAAAHASPVHHPAVHTGPAAAAPWWSGQLSAVGSVAAPAPVTRLGRGAAHLAAVLRADAATEPTGRRPEVPVSPSQAGESADRQPTELAGQRQSPGDARADRALVASLADEVAGRLHEELEWEFQRTYGTGR